MYFGVFGLKMAGNGTGYIYLRDCAHEGQKGMQPD